MSQSTGLFDTKAVGFFVFSAFAGAALAGLFIGFFLRGGTPAVALFIAGAMAILVIVIGGSGPNTSHLALEEISA